MTISQPKLQQLHARLEAYVESDPRIPNATGGMVTKRDLRDLVACFLDEPATKAKDDANRCAVCGWPLAEDVVDGCVRGNCSQRQRPERLYAPERAEDEHYAIVTPESPGPATDVDAAPPCATTDVDAAFAVLMASFDVLSPGDHAVAVIVGELWRQGEEIARLRAEAKSEPAGRKFWILLSPDGESRHVYDSATEPMIGGGWSIVRAVLDPEQKP